MQFGQNGTTVSVLRAGGAVLFECAACGLRMEDPLAARRHNCVGVCAA